jgi:hypothetical protein
MQDRFQKVFTPMKTVLSTPEVFFPRGESGLRVKEERTSARGRWRSVQIPDNKHPETYAVFFLA